jgi:3-isopropylmalate/(R)-2-methylmalate dehydratase large subunit
MGHTIAEKILSRASGAPDLTPGDHVFADVDLTRTSPTEVSAIFEEEGIDEVWDPSKIVVVNDHGSQETIDEANEKIGYRRFVEEHDIEHFFDVGHGIGHSVLPENGLVRPGDLIVAGDSHSVTYGAFGAAGTGVGASDKAYIAATGQAWLRVPETIRFHVTGEFPTYTSAKDLVLHIAGEYGTDVARYKAIEYTGPAIEALPLDERIVLANMAVELGGKFGFTPVDEVVTDFVDERTDEPYDPVRSDEDADYERTYEIDASELRPKVSKPHRVGNVADVDEVSGVALDQVFIGTCTHGKYEDLARAADILEGRTVASGTRLIVTQASREIFTRIARDGILETFNDAGATVTNATCGACIGFGSGVVGDGEVCLAAQNRNFKGRMGSDTAEIYLSSPETAAASAISGRITPPEGV